jgi:mono/diheme cytochrome c family protein
MRASWVRKAKLVIGVVVVCLIGLASLPAKAQDAAALYKTKCVACHGADGKGETAIGKTNKIRDLGSPEVQKESDADLTAVVTAGKGKMPAYGKSLKPEQVKDLVAYIRTLAKK